MLTRFRNFQAGPDLLGRTWRVEFLWLQNAIAIRRSDTVDVKFALSSGEEKRAIVIALPHPLLLELSQRAGRPITDPWCARLAATYLKHVIETGEDFEKPIVTARKEVLEALLSLAPA
ncbi:MAG: hypothetical protein RMI94_00625 [Bryobacterales bacterium]|nr:hypothetical protein [Bryobacteraceae bacterium]MDW8129024.1 hypothetical protein [Bryobacterales bacterium]